MPVWAAPPNPPILVMLGETRADAPAALRVLRHRLELRRAEGMWTFGVTSARDGEGKSTLAAQLALVLSEAQRARVLLDRGRHRATHARATARLPGPRGSRLLGADLAGACAAAPTRGRCSRSVRPSMRSSRARRSPDIRARCTRRRSVRPSIGSSRGYDWVIIDAPSVLGSGDANVVEEVVDGMIVVDPQPQVARHRAARRDEAARATQGGRRRHVGRRSRDRGPQTVTLRASRRALRGSRRRSAASCSARMHRWIAGWARDRARKAMIARPEGERHVLVAVCDHFEPLHGGRRARSVSRASAPGANATPRWRAAFATRTVGRRATRSSSPARSITRRFVEPLAEMVEAGLGEVEVHLHHDGDTRALACSDKLAQTLTDLEAHGVVPERSGRPGVGVHPRQLGARERPARRAMVRRRRRARAPPRARLLRRLHVPERARPLPAVDRQPHLLSARRVAPARLRLHGRSGGGPRPARVLLVQGPLALARREAHRGVGRADRVRRSRRRRSPDRRLVSRRGSTSSSTSTAGRSGRS